jgi:hypothetical protein
MPGESDDLDRGDGISLERHVVRITSYLIQLTSFTGRLYVNLPPDKRELLREEFRELAAALSDLVDPHERK